LHIEVFLHCVRFNNNFTLPCLRTRPLSHLIYLRFFHLITFLLILFIFVLFISMPYSVFHLLLLILLCFFSSFLFLLILLSFHYLDFQLAYFHFLPSVISSFPSSFSNFFTCYLLSYSSSFHIFAFLLSSSKFPSATTN
jgi:hypothetical protein